MRSSVPRLDTYAIIYMIVYELHAPRLHHLPGPDNPVFVTPPAATDPLS